MTDFLIDLLCILIVYVALGVVWFLDLANYYSNHDLW